MSASLQFTLLGTGSSGGVPRIGNDWGDCDPNEPKNRRRRCSALLEKIDPATSDTTRILIDTSPDLREQLLDARVSQLDAVVFTHDHADQTHGLDDLRVIAINMRQQVRVQMDDATARTLIPKFKYCFEGEAGYPAILKELDRIDPYVPFSIDGAAGEVSLLPLLQEHGPIQSLGFRTGGLAYCNDVSALPEQTKGHLKGTEVLIIDALRRAPHPTHAHLDQALEWISMLEPKSAILTNLHIDMDYATLCKELPEHVRPGYDGMTIQIEAKHDFP